MATRSAQRFGGVQSAAELARLARRRQWKLALWAFVLAVIGGFIFVIGQGQMLFPLVVLGGLGMVVAAWCYPQVMATFTLVGACLIEMTISLDFHWPRTDQIPLFWNCNTIVQRYAAMPSFHAIPVSPYELVMIVAFISWVIKTALQHDYSTRVGAIMPFIGAFIASVGVALVNGIGSGGEVSLALFEVRSLIYFAFAYLMSVNSPTEPIVQTKRMLWIVAICVGFKALQAVVRYIGELHGHTIPEVGIGSHEESFFFDAFMIQYMILWLANVEPKLRTFMAIMMPIVIWMNLVNQRRASTAAFIIAIPIVLSMAYVAFAERRQLIKKVILFGAIASAIYFPVFWNKSGTIAQPARAIKSQFSPDLRDSLSNSYRVAEDGNLFDTLQESPVIGYGYGKPFLITHEMIDLSKIDPLIHIIPHNSILWIWMRTGTVGYVAFWLMCAYIVISAGQTCRDSRFSAIERVVGVNSGVVMMMLLIFGLLDMQLANLRDTLFAGIWVGHLAYVRWARKADDEPEPEPEPEAPPVPEYRQRRAWQRAAR